MNTHDVSALQKQILVQLQLWRYGSENVGWLSITTALQLFDKCAGSLKNKPHLPLSWSHDLEPKRIKHCTALA